MDKKNFTLQVRCQFAHHFTVQPQTGDGLTDGHRHAYERHQEIGDGKVHQKIVGHAVNITKKYPLVIF